VSTLNSSATLAADYPDQDALGLAELIAKKQISPLELLSAVRDRTEALNPKINAFSQLFFDLAEAQIKSGLRPGPFSGVPFALKDIHLQFKGTKTTYGSRVYRDSVATINSTLVERYRDAGLVFIGKTTTPEFGLATTTESVAYGLTRNPWNLERTAGGSSGGAAAVVASRILPAAHGSDGGGSIRIPASCCGLFGLKPTRGRVPLGPTAFEGWNGFTSHHVLTRSVRDSAALLDISVGAETGSPFFSPRPERSFLGEVSTSPGRLRIALVVEPYLGSKLDQECRHAVLEAAKLCESLGHHVDAKELPIDASSVSDSFLTIFRVSVARLIDDLAKTLGRPATEKDIEPVTWETALLGRQISSVNYSRAIASVHQVGLSLARFQENFDIILSPTLGKPPVEFGPLSLSPPDIAMQGRNTGEFSPFTSLYNVTGQPSMSVPLHMTPDGLPVGVMFSGRFGDEATLFRLAGQLEKARPWAMRKPPLIA
jgi:amidase/6-aminohexanoate-cyclic-dimer hydrolase